MTPRCCVSCEQEYEYDADRHLRGRRHVPDRLPGADQHRRPDEAPAGRQRRASCAAKGWACRGEALGRHHPRGVGRVDRRRQAAQRPGHRAEPAGPQGDRSRHVAAVVAGAARRRPVPAPRCHGACSAAGTPCGPIGISRAAAEAVYFTACVGTMFGPSEAGPGVRESFAADLSSGRHHADLPGRPAGSVLRNAVAVQGNEGRLRRDGRAGCCPRCGRPAGRVSCRSCVTRRPAPRGCGRCWKPRSPPPTAGYATLRIVDAVAFVEEQVLPQLVADPEDSGAWRCTPPARPPGWG